MNIRYYHEFKGLDNVINRFEILTDGVVKSMEIKASGDALSLEYPEARKLDPMRGSQATMNLISESVFQFVDLHTDEMRKYLVKFYRAGSLYWIGWLDSELYGEELSAVPPYEVTFKASDFNIMERLRYRDGSENRYTDIVPFITHIRRCLDKLGLSFNKLYIGCTTTAEGVTLSASETVLHQLYMMSDNFYDEDKEPMSCREVVEEILKPFGLMLVQKYGNLYIYDYNTVKGGLPMKRYAYATFLYEADETVNFNQGNLYAIGFASTDSSYGFEEMINNVKITSSLYADKSVVEAEATEKNLSELVKKEETDILRKELFAKCDEIEKIGSQNFVVYTEKDSENTIIGASSPYDPFRGDYSKALFRVKSKMSIISTDSKKNSLLLKMNCYVSSSENPFTAEFKGESDAELCQIAANLYTVNGNGTPLYYYHNVLGKPRWVSCSPNFQKGAMRIVFCSQTVKGSNIYDTQLTNSNMSDTRTAFDSVKQKDYGKGLVIPIGSNIYGQIILEIIGASVYKRMRMEHSDDLFFSNGGENVKDIIYNDIDIKIVDDKKEDISTDDYEFNSYINKNVKTDFDEVTLKCISANEEKVPIGKANVLRKVGDHYELQLSFSRSGQADILERLLMCTIHSNFTTKNERISVDIKMTDNPALGYVDYAPILSDKYLVIGCKLDFPEATTTVTAVGYSEDTASLSDIPYD